MLTRNPLDTRTRQAARLGKRTSGHAQRDQKPSRRTSPGCMGLSFFAIVVLSW
jgi:hypothetical protein